MTDDMKLSDEVTQAADLAVAMARTFHRMTGSPDNYVATGGLGFGCKVGASGQLTIEVDWYGDPRLHVMQPAQADLPRLVIPFEGDAAWIEELANSLEDLKQADANRL